MWVQPGNDQLRQIGLQPSVRTGARNQPGGQLRMTPETNDDAGKTEDENQLGGQLRKTPKANDDVNDLTL